MANAVRHGIADVGHLPVTSISRHHNQGVARALGRIANPRPKGQHVPRGCHDKIASSAVRLCNSRQDHSGSGSVSWHVARGAVNDAHLGGVPLNARTMQEVLHLGIDDPNVMRGLIHGFESLGLDRPSVLHALADMGIANASLEQLLAVVCEMRKSGIKPVTAVVDHFVRLAARENMCRAALEVADEHEMDPSRGRLDPDTWFALLAGSVWTSFVPGIQAALPRVLANRDCELEEGILLSVLDSAARSGDTRLAMHAMDNLASNGIKGQEHHITALLEASLRGGEIEGALRLACSAAARNLTVHQRGLQSLVRALRTTSLIDEALAALEDIKNQDAHVPGSALESVMSASIQLGDLARTRTAHILGRNWGVFTDARAYNAVIDSCIERRDSVLGNAVFGELLADGLQPDSATMGSMARLAIATGSYEDAFDFLEQINAKGWRAEESLYRDLYNICVDKRDGRWRTVLAEARACDYNLVRFSHGDASKLS